MKKSLKTFLTLAGAALATSVAQANPYATATDLLVANVAAVGHPAQYDYISVATEVDLTAGVYTYTYTLTTAGTPADSKTPVDIDSFTVGTGGLITGTVNAGSITATPTTFGGVFSGNEVSWANVPPGVNYPVPATGSGLSFSFTSPDAPIAAYSGALDNSSYVDGDFSGQVPSGDDVLVPGAPAVPDGGLTVALLGGSLLGLQMIRRKLVS